jgi:antitoxin ParD1/3/4
MPTRNISLTPQIDDFVEKNVSTGQYQNASEVVRDALRLLQARQRAEKLKLQRLREAVDIGLAELERGEYTELDSSEMGNWIANIGKRVARKTSRR